MNHCNAPIPIVKRIALNKSYCMTQPFIQYIIVKFLQGKRKYRKRQAKISADISAHFFRVMCNKVSGILTNTQKLNCWCQELDPTHFTISLVPTWWNFTSSSEFKPPGEFYPNPKNVRNTTIIANTNIFIDFVSLKNYPPSKMYWFEWSV